MARTELPICSRDFELNLQGLCCGPHSERLFARTRKDLQMPYSLSFFCTAGTVKLWMLSADADKFLRWLVGFRRRPAVTFIAHGDPVASAALGSRIRIEPGWASHLPQPIERVAPA